MGRTIPSFRMATVEELKEWKLQIELLVKKQEKFEQLIQSLIDSGQLKRAL
ncbi:MAG: hypothetical protein WBP64_09970 [Nitrososphaeraceae archaeon]